MSRQQPLDREAVDRLKAQYARYPRHLHAAFATGRLSAVVTAVANGDHILPEHRIEAAAAREVLGLTWPPAPAPAPVTVPIEGIEGLYLSFQPEVVLRAVEVAASIRFSLARVAEEIGESPSADIRLQNHRLRVHNLINNAGTLLWEHPEGEILTALGFELEHDFQPGMYSAAVRDERRARWESAVEAARAALRDGAR